MKGIRNTLLTVVVLAAACSEQAPPTEALSGSAVTPLAGLPEGTHMCCIHPGMRTTAEVHR